MNTPSIGYAQNIITPSLERPVFLAGFGQNRRAVDVHDELFARALAVSDGQATLVLCALDLIGFFRADAREVAAQVQAEVPGVEIVIASTHTHHGPDTIGLWGPDMKTRGVDEAYLAALKQKVTQTILAALGSMQPCTGIKTAAIHIPGVAKNARNPEIVDDELTLFQCLSSEGKPLVSVFNFPCHPEVLWEHNPHITADYPAFLRLEVERQTGAPCIFFAGALGGMMTPDVKDHSFAEAEFMGLKLAQQGLQALGSISPGPYRVSLQKKEIKARLTNILYKIAFRRKLLPDVRDNHGYVTSEVNLIKIGDLWLATVPGEMLPRLGLALKAQLLAAGAKVAGVIGLANDELGYILPVEDFKYPWNPFRPGNHYEETNSIGKEIASAIMKALNSLL